MSDQSKPNQIMIRYGVDGKPKYWKGGCGSCEFDPPQDATNLAAGADCLLKRQSPCAHCGWLRPAFGHQWHLVDQEVLS